MARNKSRSLGNVPLPDDDWTDPTLREALEETAEWADSQQLTAQQVKVYQHNIRLLQEHERLWAVRKRELMQAWYAEPDGPSTYAMAEILGVTRTQISKALNNK